MCKSHELWPLVYEELEILARRRLAHERNDGQLPARALVHETYLRLATDRESHWQSRAHFFGAAAAAMRRVLIDSARERHRLKRRRTPRDLNDCGEVADAVSLSARQRAELRDAMIKLGRSSPLKAALVRLKFYYGMPTHQAARVLDVAPRTAERYWQQARLWLQRELGAD